VYDHKGTEYVIVRRVIGWRYLVIPKYVAIGGTVRRIVETYSARSVVAAGEAVGILAWEPHYAATVPLIDVSREAVLCCPSFGDHVFPELYRALPSLRRLVGGFTHCVGLTGSLLAGHWSPQYSDIDIIVNIDRDCLQLLRELSESLQGLKGLKRERWLEKEAEKRNMPVSVIKLMASRWQRVVLDGHVVSLAPVSVASRMAEEERWFFPSPSRTGSLHHLCLEQWLSALGDYPAVIEAGGSCLVLYDGFYVPRLLEGGCFEAHGPLVDVVRRGRSPLQGCVAIGGREGGYLKPLPQGS
jgi:hypothetical protein